MEFTGEPIEAFINTECITDARLEISARQMYDVYCSSYDSSLVSFENFNLYLQERFIRRFKENELFYRGISTIASVSESSMQEITQELRPQELQMIRRIYCDLITTIHYYQEHFKIYGEFAETKMNTQPRSVHNIIKESPMLNPRGKLVPSYAPTKSLEAILTIPIPLVSFSEFDEDKCAILLAWCDPLCRASNELFLVCILKHERMCLMLIIDLARYLADLLLIYYNRHIVTVAH